MTGAAPHKGLVWLVSYPSSGNTWVRVILENLLSGPGARADINALRHSGTLVDRLGMEAALGLDTAAMTHPELAARRADWARVAAQSATGARVIKLHDAYAGAGLIPPEVTRAVVYVVRNPLDVAHAYAAHLGASVDQAMAHMADPAHLLTEPPHLLTPNLRQHMGTWSGHVTGWLDAPLDVRVLRYEDLHDRPVEALTQAFAGCGLPADPDRWAQAVQASRFKALADQEAAAGFGGKPSAAQVFFRKGQAGAWRGALTPAQIARIQQDHGRAMARLGYGDDTEDTGGMRA